jgi:hypothetical protein
MVLEAQTISTLQAVRELCSARPVMAQRDRCRHIEFMVGIGGIADMNGWVASANSVGFDPERSLA